MVLSQTANAIVAALRYASSTREQLPMVLIVYWLCVGTAISADDKVARRKFTLLVLCRAVAMLTSPNSLGMSPANNLMLASHNYTPIRCALVLIGRSPTSGASVSTQVQFIAPML